MADDNFAQMTHKTNDNWKKTKKNIILMADGRWGEVWENDCNTWKTPQGRPPVAGD